MPLTVTKVSGRPDEVVTVFLYGPSGSLKTRSACSFPVPLVANFERGGLKSARDFPDVHEIVVPDWTTMVEVSVSLTKLREQTGFKTLVIDSLTIAFERCVREVARSNANAYPALRDYGIAADKLRECLRICMDWCDRYRAHFVVTALDQATKDEVLGTVRGAPDVGRKVGEELAPMFDIYGHLTMSFEKGTSGAGTMVRRLWTVQRDVFPAKDRLGVLAPSEDLSSTTLWSVLHEKAPWLMA
jgi:hypothetical protein